MNRRCCAIFAARVCGCIDRHFLRYPPAHTLRCQSNGCCDRSTGTACRCHRSPRQTRRSVRRSSPSSGASAHRSPLSPGADVGRGEPSPGADVGRGEPSPGADVGRGEPSPGAVVGRGEPSPGADVGRGRAHVAGCKALRYVRSAPSHAIARCGTCPTGEYPSGSHRQVRAARALHADRDGRVARLPLRARRGPLPLQEAVHHVTLAATA